jgi:hypothetical protein
MEMRASYNGITSAFQADDVGSIPTARSKIYADIAQLVERTLGKGEVGSSNLPISTSFFKAGLFYFATSKNPTQNLRLF